MRVRKVSCLIAIALLPLLALAACDRKITRVEQIAEPTTCFNCHGDTPGDSILATMIPAQQQWENSRHGSGILINEGQNSPGCAGCHTGNGFIARANGQAPGNYPNPETIHCFACHAPHTTGTLELRWKSIATAGDSVTFELHNADICGACHHARRSVNAYVRHANHRTIIDSSHWGPHHSSQLDMLLATNGYEYPGFDYQDTPFHRTLTKDGCLDCHFKTTSNNVVGGHSFNQEGVVEGDTIQNIAGCQVCHGEDVTDFNIDGIQDSVVTLAHTLATRLEAAGLLDVEGNAIPQTTSQDSAGALWNWQHATGDRSEGVHNPKYIISLLQSSIDFLEGTLPPHLETPPLAEKRMVLPPTPGQKYTVMVRPAPRK